MQNKKYKKALLIDDDKIINYVQQRIIDSFNLADELIVKDSGASALAYLRDCMLNQRLPDIIFLDLHMPIMTGFDFLVAFDKLIKELHYPWNKNDCKVIVLTSSYDREDIRKAAENHYVYGYLNKPITKEVIKEIYL